MPGILSNSRQRRCNKGTFLFVRLFADWGASRYQFHRLTLSRHSFQTAASKVRMIHKSPYFTDHLATRLLTSRYGRFQPKRIPSHRLHWKLSDDEADLADPKRTKLYIFGDETNRLSHNGSKTDTFWWEAGVSVEFPRTNPTETILSVAYRQLWVPTDQTTQISIHRLRFLPSIAYRRDSGNAPRSTLQSIQ